MGLLIIIVLFLIIGTVFSRMMKVDQKPQTPPQMPDFTAEDGGWSALERYNRDIENPTNREFVNSERGQNAPPAMYGYGTDNQTFDSMSDSNEKVLTDFTPESYVFGESTDYKGFNGDIGQNGELGGGSFAPGGDYKFGGMMFGGEGTIAEPISMKNLTPIEVKIGKQSISPLESNDGREGRNLARFGRESMANDGCNRVETMVDKPSTLGRAVSLSDSGDNMKSIALTVSNFNFRDAVIFSAILNPKFNEENCSTSEFLI